MGSNSVIAVIVVLLALIIGVFLSQAPSTPPLIQATVRQSINGVRTAFSNDRNACEKRDWNNNTALHFAAKMGSIKLIDELVRPQIHNQSTDQSTSRPIGCDVNALNSANTSVLHWAAASKTDDPAVFLHLLHLNQPTIQSTNQPITHKMLYHLNARNESVLHWAVEWKSQRVVEEIINLIKPSTSSSTNLLDQPDENGDTPMHRLTIDCASDRACQSIAASLIRAGANLTFENYSKRTPLQRITFDQAFNQSITDSVNHLHRTADEFRRNLTDQFHTV